MSHVGAAMPKRWRVGRKVGRTIYDGDRLVGMMDTPGLARIVVGALNGEFNIEANEPKPITDAGLEERASEYCDKNGHSLANQRRVTAFNAYLAGARENAGRVNVESADAKRCAEFVAEYFDQGRGVILTTDVTDDLIAAAARVVKGAS